MTAVGEQARGKKPPEQMQPLPRLLALEDDLVPSINPANDWQVEHFDSPTSSFVPNDWADFSYPELALRLPKLASHLKFSITYHQSQPDKVTRDFMVIELHGYTSSRSKMIRTTQQLVANMQSDSVLSAQDRERNFNQRVAFVQVDAPYEFTAAEIGSALFDDLAEPRAEQTSKRFSRKDEQEERRRQSRETEEEDELMRNFLPTTKKKQEQRVPLSALESEALMLERVVLDTQPSAELQRSQQRYWWRIDESKVAAQLLRGGFRKISDDNMAHVEGGHLYLHQLLLHLEWQYQQEWYPDAAHRRRPCFIMMGFSQGGGQAYDFTMLHYDRFPSIRGLAICSGLITDFKALELQRERMFERDPALRESWDRYRARTLYAVFHAHGEQDFTLAPFVGNSFLDELSRHGFREIHKLNFDGPHELPTIVRLALIRYINDVIHYVDDEQQQQQEQKK
jgi:hypothetical protein